MIARNKPPLRIETGLNPGPTGQNCRNFVCVHVSYRAFLRARAFRPYLKNGGTLENAAAMANHASTRTTQLYDRRHDDISLDEVERVRI
jgi:hypothetical protein